MTYTLTLTATPRPSGGTITFYDGSDPISAGCTGVPLTVVSATKVKATCTTSYGELGERWTTAVYSGDLVYKAVAGNPMKKTISPSGLPASNFFICTGSSTRVECGASGACTTETTPTPWSNPPASEPCGRVLLHAMTGGVLYFQDRTSNFDVRLWPSVGLAPCTDQSPTWMTDGVPGTPEAAAPVPRPCGQLGGISGTIYAPYAKTTAASPVDTFVNVKADGSANIQIVSARIRLSYNTEMRFTFDPSEFAGGSICLTE